MPRGPVARRRYRVNFGDGSASPQTFRSVVDADKFVAAARQHGGDPHARRYFVEAWDPIAGWFAIDTRRRARR